MLTALGLWSCLPSPDLSGGAGGPADREPEIYPTSTEYGSVSALTWNIEWLGDSTHGPSDEARQLSLAIDTLSFAKADVIGLQEVSSAASAASLAASLPGYGLSLAQYEQRQKVALLYREARIELLSVAAITGLDDAGRPPLEARVRTTQGRELTVIVLHAKAGDDPRSYQIRARFAQGLRAYLEAHHAASDLLMLGDFNDLFGSSTLEGMKSPYDALTAGGTFVAATAALETQPERSTKWGDTVDHIVLSRSLATAVVSDSVETLRDELLARQPDFFELASDHAPVVLELKL